MKHAFSTSIFALLIGLTQASFVCTRAHAALGGDESALDDDRRAISGIMRAATSHGRYTVYEIAASGCTVREYVTLDGKVFGVAWQGIAPPDLKLLLGSYFEEFSVASKSEAREARSHSRRSHHSIHGPNTVVERSGHMRDLRGRAYVDALLPEKVSIDEIR